MLIYVEKECTEAFDAHADELFRHAYFRLSDRERAKDLVQETFLKVWTSAERGTKIENWRAFLFRSLHNLIIDEYRKKKQSSLDAILEADVSEGNFPELVGDNFEETVSALDGKIDEQVLHEAIAKLPEQYQSAVVMRYIDERSPKEIAELLGENENVVSVRVHRGLKKLRAIMEATPKHYD
ncbi:MAG: RNA polymerase sigma factor [Patescibacteria group bacterium]